LEAAVRLTEAAMPPGLSTKPPGAPNESDAPLSMLLVNRLSKRGSSARGTPRLTEIQLESFTVIRLYYVRGKKCLVSYLVNAVA